MPRTARIAPGGMIFHVLNRANNRDEMFERGEDRYGNVGNELCPTIIHPFPTGR